MKKIITLNIPNDALKYKEYFINDMVEEIIITNPTPPDSFIRNMLKLLGISTYVAEFGYMTKRITKIPFKITLGEGVTSISGLFNGCSLIEEAPMIDTSKVTDFSNLFKNCVFLKKIPNYDFSNAKNMNSVFSHCMSLEKAPIIRAPKATNFAECFTRCEVLNSVPVLEMDNAENANSMFKGCNFLKEIPIINCPKIVNTARMFYCCHDLREVDFNSKICPEDASEMFHECRSLVKFPNIDFQKAVDKYRLNRFDLCDGSSILMNYPFKEWGRFEVYYTKNVGKRLLSAWRDSILRNDYDKIVFHMSIDDQNNNNKNNVLKIGDSILSGVKELVILDCDIVIDRSVTDLTGFFKNCKNLRYIRSITIEGDVKSTESMFEGCSSLESVPIFNTSSVTNMKKMFAGCKSLKSVPKFDTKAVTINDGMFDKCICLQKNTNDANESSSENLCSNKLDLSLKNVIKPLDYTVNKSDLVEYGEYVKHLVRRIMNNELELLLFNYRGFSNDSSLNIFAKYNFFRRLDFKIEFARKVTDLKFMFKGMRNLEYIKEIGDTSTVTDFNHTFADCVSLKEIPKINTISAEDTNSMFENCIALEKIPELNTSHVTSMKKMFANCRALKKIPELDTSQVDDMNRMFLNCENLQEPPLINMAKVATMTDMFKGCSKLGND